MIKCNTTVDVRIISLQTMKLGDVLLQLRVAVILQINRGKWCSCDSPGISPGMQQEQHACCMRIAMPALELVHRRRHGSGLHSLPLW